MTTVHPVNPANVSASRHSSARHSTNSFFPGTTAGTLPFFRAANEHISRSPAGSAGDTVIQKQQTSGTGARTTGPTTGTTTGPTTGVHVWASQLEGRDNVCATPTLHPAPGRGQPGWHAGIRYTTLSNMLSQVRTRMTALRVTQIGRLAISCHGLAGSADIEGSAYGPITFVRLKTALRNESAIRQTSGLMMDIIAPPRPAYNLAYYTRVINELRQIRSLMSPNSMVMFVGCLSAQSQQGVLLLRLLASPALLNRTVLGFTTTTASLGGRQLRPGDNCTEPGNLVTNNPSPSISGNTPLSDPGHIDHAGANLPWADENAHHSRIARPDGSVIETDNMEHGSNLPVVEPTVPEVVQHVETTTERAERERQESMNAYVNAVRNGVPAARLNQAGQRIGGSSGSRRYRHR